MTSREQFERQCRNGLVNGGLAVFENGVYVSELTRAVWSGWQASRAAVEIEVNRLNIEIENLECAHICLDDVGVPRKEGDETLSLWGRIVMFKSSTKGY